VTPARRERARRGGPAGRDRAGDPGAPVPERELPIDHRPELLADDARRARRGTIELVAVMVVVLALIALAVWFFLFAHNPLLRP
jgi:predicted nucleic acid-binding Zn ribbon protein